MNREQRRRLLRKLAKRYKVTQVSIVRYLNALYRYQHQRDAFLKWVAR